MAERSYSLTILSQFLKFIQSVVGFASSLNFSSSVDFLQHPQMYDLIHDLNDDVLLPGTDHFSDCGVESACVTDS
jgi:hypothetical protein